MITPPIYRLDIGDSKYLDMNKLEHISELKEHVPGKFTIIYWFSYQINGFVYDSASNTDKSIVFQERENLITEWKNFMGYRE